MLSGMKRVSIKNVRINLTFNDPINLWTFVVIFLGCLVCAISGQTGTSIEITALDANVIVGHTAKFQCRVNQVPSGYSVGWKHGDFVISVDGETVITNEDHYEVFRDSQTEHYLYLVNATTSDANLNFRCVIYGRNATSFMESGDASIAVTHTPTTSWPICHSQVTEKEQFNPGHALSVTCAARGKGQTWLLLWSRSDGQDSVHGPQRLYPYLPDIGFQWTLSEDDDGVRLTCIAVTYGESDKTCDIGPIRVTLSSLVLEHAYVDSLDSTVSLSLTCSLDVAGDVPGVSYMWVYDDQYISTSGDRFTLGNEAKSLSIYNITSYDVGNSVQCTAHAAVIRDKYASYVITLPTDEPIISTVPLVGTTPTATTSGRTLPINSTSIVIEVTESSSAIIATAVLTGGFGISTITLSIIIVVWIIRSRRRGPSKQQAENTLHYDEAVVHTLGGPSQSNSLHYEVAELKLDRDKNTTGLKNGSNISYVNTAFHEKNATSKQDPDSKLVYDVVREDARRPRKALKPKKHMKHIPTKPTQAASPQQEQSHLYKSLNRKDMTESSPYESPIRKPPILTKPKDFKKKLNRKLEQRT